MADETPLRQRLTPGLPKGPENVKAYLLSKGWPEDRAEREAQKVAVQMLSAPQDWTGMVALGLKTAIPFLVARYIPGGGGLIQATKQVLANVAGQATIGGTAQAIQTGQPSQFLGGAAQAGVQAVPGAVAQGGLGMALLPRKSTVRTQQAITDFQKGLSPEVGRLLDPAKPKELFSAGTVDRMMKTAGKKLDEMEAAIQQGVGDTRFSVPLKPSSESTAAPPLFGPSGARIRDSALQQLITKAQKGSQMMPATEGNTFTEIRDHIKTLRTGAYDTRSAKMDAKRQANHLEKQLLADMRGKGFSDLADQYRQALLAHAKDMVGVRGIKWVQTQQRRPGGASPVDDPELADAMDHLASKGLGQEARLTLAGLFAAARHPFLAAGEVIQAAKQAGKVVDVKRIKGPMTPTRLRQVVPPAAGAAVTGILGRPSGATVNPAMDDLTQAEQDLGTTDVHVGELDTLIKSLQ